jgi:hypothetical protein
LDDWSLRSPGLLPGSPSQPIFQTGGISEVEQARDHTTCLRNKGHQLLSAYHMTGIMLHSLIFKPSSRINATSDGETGSCNKAMQIQGHSTGGSHSKARLFPLVHVARWPEKNGYLPRGTQARLRKAEHSLPWVANPARESWRSTAQ